VSRPGHDQSKATALFLTTVIFGKQVRCMIDSGAERSILPVSLVPSSVIFPDDTKLVTVTGNSIDTYGHCVANVEVKSLRRDFKVTFIVAKTKAILGADFLTKYGLHLDMRNRLLIDPLTTVSANLSFANAKEIGIRVSSAGNIKSFIADFFPDVLKAPDYSCLPLKIKEVHKIETQGQPVFSRPRPLSPDKLETAKKEFDALLKLGIVRPSNSPWASPLHMVKKADGSWRPCGDYRLLNARTVPDRYAIPNLQSIHFKLQGSKVYSRLDLVKAYHFIPVQEEDVKKTAICTPFGTYEYLRMPFGLRNAANSFQRFIDDVVRGLPYVVTYIDDLLIFSNSREEHEEHLKEVLTRFNEVGLKINHKKTALFQTSIDFLGFNFCAEGIKPLEERVSSLLKLPAPTDSKCLLRYLGMFGFYQRCIPRYTEIVQPLREALRLPKLIWNHDLETAFGNLKDALCNAVRLCYPLPGATYMITCDASSYAIGACLHQNKNGNSTPLCFFSRKLSTTEQRYSAFDRELLAIYASVKKWKDFISGSHCTVCTDHKPLIGAFNSGKSRDSDRQQRQIAFVTEYVSDIIHISGKTNVVADTLSRSVSEISTELTQQNPIDLISIAKGQADSIKNLPNIKEFKIDNNLSIFCETTHANPRPFVPESMRKDVFVHFHSLSHPGIKGSTKLIGSRYFWPSLKVDIKAWVSQCLSCQSSKVTQHTKRPLGELPCPTQRFLTVHLDIVGPLNSSEADASGCRYLLTMIDSFSRWVEVFPMSDIAAHSVCRGFLFSWVARFGPPLFIVTDKGTQFCSELLCNLTNALGINQIRTTSYNPKANGLIERFHRSLKAALMAHGGNWLKELPLVLLGLRMHPDDDGSCAISRLTGEQPVIPPVLLPCGNLTEVSKALQQLSFPYRLTRGRSVKKQRHSSLDSSTHVWLRLDRVRKPLEAPYQGPYKVLRRCGTTFTIEVKGKPEVVSIERVKPANVSGTATDEGTTEKADVTARPVATEDTQRGVETADEQQTRTGRRVKFRKDHDYLYF